jgi:2'-5' RNA ligase
LSKSIATLGQKFRKQSIIATIVKTKGKREWCVKSKKGKNLGCSESKSGAESRLRQVEYFKHKKSAVAARTKAIQILATGGHHARQAMKHLIADASMDERDDEVIAWLQIPKEVEKQVRVIQKQIRSLAKEQDIKVTTKSESLLEPHVTLLYLGDLASRKQSIDEAFAIFQDVVAKARPGPLKITAIDYFHNAESSVCKLKVEGQWLTDLHNAYRTALSQVGIKVDHFSGVFSPHITLQYLEPKKALKNLPKVSLKWTQRTVSFSAGFGTVELNIGSEVKVASDKLPGGLADNIDPKQFDQSAVDEGAEVEMEHTNDREVAREIARDHLSEDPYYYRKLKRVEKTAAQVFTKSDFRDVGHKDVLVMQRKEGWCLIECPHCTWAATYYLKAVADKATKGHAPFACEGCGRYFEVPKGTKLTRLDKLDDAVEILRDPMLAKYDRDVTKLKEPPWVMDDRLRTILKRNLHLISTVKDFRPDSSVITGDSDWEDDDLYESFVELADAIGIGQKKRPSKQDWKKIYRRYKPSSTPKKWQCCTKPVREKDRRQKVIWTANCRYKTTSGVRIMKRIVSRDNKPPREIKINDKRVPFCGGGIG